MTLHLSVQECLYQRARVDPFGSYNSVGDATYSTASSVTYQALQEEEQHIVVNLQGREQLARGRIYIGQTTTGGTPSIGARDKLYTPNSTSDTPPILAVDTVRDEDSVHHQVVHYG